MSYTAVHAEEVVALVGQIDASLVERIVETGATIDEIAEALSELEISDRGATSSPRVAEVRALLAPLFEDGSVARARE